MKVNVFAYQIKNTLPFSIVIAFLFIPLFYSNGICQKSTKDSIDQTSPYQFSWKRESAFIGSSIIAYTSGAILDNKVRLFTDKDILALSRSNINRFDRVATFKNSYMAARTSDYFLIGSYILPNLFLFNKKTKKEFGHIALLYGETIILNHSITFLTKRSLRRSRPFVFNELANFESKKTKQARYSFFSGHTSATAANCFFFAKVYAQFYPDSKLRPYIWTAAAIIPAATGWLRVEGGKHFYTDVLTGYAVGAFIGYMVPHLHRNKRKNKLSIYPTPIGFGLRWALNK